MGKHANKNRYILPIILSVTLYYVASKCHVLIHQLVGMRLFAHCIMTLAQTIYLKLNLVVTTVLHVLNPSYLQTLLAQANALGEAIMIRDGIFALSNANHLSVKELNYLIESLTLDRNEKKLTVFIIYIYLSSTFIPTLILYVVLLCTISIMDYKIYI